MRRATSKKDIARTPFRWPGRPRLKKSAVVAFLQRNLDNLGVAVLLSLNTFLIGQCTARQEELAAADRFNLETKNRILNSATVNFSVYVTHWARLRTIAEPLDEKKKRLGQVQTRVLEIDRATPPSIPGKEERDKLLVEKSELDELVKELLTRRNGYVKGRDDAKDKLLGDLEQAKLFFSAPIGSKIDAFVKFDESQRSLTVKDLAPLDDWRKYGQQVFSAMREEIKRESP